MSDQTDELIREIAAKHGIAVSRDDPILILQTINARLMQDSAKAQQAMPDRYKEELEALALRWGSDVKSKAERILNASLAASKEATAKLMQEGAKEAAASVRGEIDAALRRALRVLRRRSRYGRPVIEILSGASAFVFGVVGTTRSPSFGQRVGTARIPDGPAAWGSPNNCVTSRHLGVVSENGKDRTLRICHNRHTIRQWRI